MLRFGAVLLVALAAFTQASIPHRMSIGQNDKPYCDKCIHTIQYLKTMIDDPQMEQQFIQALQTVCDKPPLAPHKDECLNAISNLDVMLHKVQSAFDNPTDFCAAIHFCDGDSAASIASILKGIFLQRSKASQTLPGLNADPTTCQQCKDIVSKVKAAAASFQPLLTTAFEQICKTYSDPAQQAQCKTEVDKWFPMAWNFVLNIFCNPDLMCLIFDGCP